MAKLDVPLLENMEIEFLRSNEPVSNNSELPQFIRRVKTFKTLELADIRPRYNDILFIFSQQTIIIPSAKPSLTFFPVRSYGTLSYLTRVCGLFFSILSGVERPKLDENRLLIWPLEDKYIQLQGLM